MTIQNNLVAMESLTTTAQETISRFRIPKIPSLEPQNDNAIFVPTSKTKEELTANISIDNSLLSINASPQAKTLLRALWRSSDGTHQIGYINRANKQFKNIPVKDISEAVSLAYKNSEAGLDSYFAMAEYNTSDSRTAANASGAYGFWADLDVGEDKVTTGKGYKTVEDAETALMKFCKDAGIPNPTHIVNSGGGLHSYWAVCTLINREDWRNFAGKFKKLTKFHGFLVDPSRTADIASVLRAPGTYNYKYSPPRLVVLTYASDKYIERDVMLTAIESAHERLCITDPVASKPNDTHRENVGTATTDMHETSHNIENVKSALAAINPDCEREMWFKASCALHSLNWDCGELLARAWSKGDYWTATNQTASKYDAQAFDIMWKSIKSDAGISIGTLFHFAKEAGWAPAGYAQSNEFEVCEMVIIEPSGKIVKQPETKQLSCALALTNPLDKFSLRGRSAELEKNALDEVYVLDGIALQGEITVLFAASNTGKTVITLRLLVNAIRGGKIDPNKVYYLNMDDSGNGVILKNRIAEAYNFHMLTEGFEGFSAREFLIIVRSMIENDQAHGVVILLDTLKKFTDVMDNSKTSIFTGVMRAFAMKGGTVIALAHTNKKVSQDGKPVYGGVSSIMNDIDCAYTIAQISAANGEKVVEFDNVKRRGNVVQNAAYSYSIGNNIAYDDLLASVQFIDDAHLDTMKRTEEVKADAETIDIVLACINKGINTKMELVDAFAKRAEMSKNAAIKFIGKYTGEDTAIHKWNFTVGAHNTKTYAALKPDASAGDSEIPYAN